MNSSEKDFLRQFAKNSFRPADKLFGIFMEDERKGDNHGNEKSAGRMEQDLPRLQYRT